jgi:hypothetical protein
MLNTLLSQRLSAHCLFLFGFDRLNSDACWNRFQFIAAYCCNPATCDSTGQYHLAVAGGSVFITRALGNRRATRYREVVLTCSIGPLNLANALNIYLSYD